MTAREPRYTLHDGFRMPMGFPVEGLASGQRYRPEPGDVFVTSYPKCGTTWTQYIVYLLCHAGRPLPAGQKLDEVFPHLEEVGVERVRQRPQPRLIKTHLSFERTPSSPHARYLYVVRNPFDCAVSFYHHTRGFVRHYDFADGTWGAFFECFMRGEVDFGDYFDHLLSWWPHRADVNVLLLIYEQMLEAPSVAVAAIARFLGGSAGELARDPRRVAAVVHESNFVSMQRDQERWSSARDAAMPGFVRKGVVGDWRSMFTPEQRARLAAKFRERTVGLELEHLWPELAASELT